MAATKEAVKESMEQTTKDTIVKEVANFSKNHLVDCLKVVLPDVLQSLDFAKLTYVTRVSLQCEDLFKDHKELVAKITQASSATNKTTDEIQGNISALLNGQAQLTADMEKIKAENSSLHKLLREAYLDDVGKGKVMRKLPPSSPRGLSTQGISKRSLL